MSAERVSAEPLRAGALVPHQPTPPTVGSVRRSTTTGWPARLRRTPGGTLLLRGLVFTVGLAFVVLGCVLVVAPGPLTIPPVLLGLWIWSTEFTWADRQLDRVKASARLAWEDAQRHRVLSAVVTGGGLVALGVGIWAVSRYELLARAREVVGV